MARAVSRKRRPDSFFEHETVHNQKNLKPNSILTPEKLVNSLWMSKLRYGLQLYSQVRTTDNDAKTNNMKVAQIAQNKVLRLLDGSANKDR